MAAAEWVALPIRARRRPRTALLRAGVATAIVCLCSPPMLRGQGAAPADSPAAETGQSGGPRPSIEGLVFMAGCWEGVRGGGAVVRETFTSPRAGLVLGNGQLIVAEKTRFYEQVRIVEGGTGVQFHPTFPGQEAPVAFDLVSLEANEAVFENPEHDYPQRIVYRSPEPGTLEARTELMSGERSQGYSMAAVPCGGESHRAGTGKSAEP